MSVLILRPNSDISGNVLQEVSTGTTHYALVDEATLDEADYTYNRANVSGNAQVRDYYGFPDHTSESGTINSVTVKAYAKYILTGSSSVEATIAPFVVIGSTVYAGTQQNLTSSTALYSKQWTTNPATSAAWSWTEIDALVAGDYLKQGYVSKDNSRGAYKYQLWVEVDYTAGGGGPTPAIKIGGAWKETTSQKIKVGGSWRTVSSIKIKVGGTWKS